jgi:hypothetical protein
MLGFYTREVIPMKDWDSTLVTTEYNSLRAEILKRVEIRYQLLALTVTVFGALLAFGSQTKNVGPILLYPVLAFCLAVSWRSNQHNIWKLSDYIVEHIEAKVGNHNMYWESYCKSPGRETRAEKYLNYGSKGIFVLTEVLALLIGIIVGVTQPEPNTILLVFIGTGVSALVTVATAILLFSYTRGNAKIITNSELGEKTL